MRLNHADCMVRSSFADFKMDTIRLMMFFAWLGPWLAAAAATCSIEDVAVDIRPGNAISMAHENFELGTSGVYTVATSFSPLFAQRGGAHGIVFAFGSGWYDGMRMGIVPRDGRYSVCAEVAMSKEHPTDDGVLQLFDGESRFAAGDVVSFVTTWDGRVVRLYVDGREVVSCRHARPFVHPKNRLIEFGKGGWGRPYLPIRTFRARVWRRALSANEVTAVAMEDLAEAPNVVPMPTTSAVLLDLIGQTTEGSVQRTTLEERLAFTCLAERKFEMAETYFQKTLSRKKCAPYDARLEFRERWADAVELAGCRERADELRKQVEQDAPVALKRPYVLPEVWTPTQSASWPSEPGLVYFAAPDGNDGDGSMEHPFGSIEQAKQAVRKLKERQTLPKGGVTVFLRGGRYQMAHELAFDERDSGEPGSPVVWSAYCAEKVVLDGGWRVPVLNAVSEMSVLERIPVVAHRYVRCCDVRKAGYSHCEAPEPYGSGCGGIRKPITDLYADGIRLEPARYPNDGFLRVADAASRAFAVESGNMTALAKESALMACGFWRYFYRDMTLAIQAVDPATGWMTASGCADLSHAIGKPFFLCNALCTIDRPGEWFLDQHAGVLYVWPPDGCRELVLSGFSGTFLTASGLHDVCFDGLTFENGRLDAVNMEGCRNVKFQRSIVRNFGRHGVTVKDARNIKIAGNAISSIGGRGIFVSGGGRRTLTAAENVVSDNEISFTGRRIRTYAPGLELRGCGMDVVRNYFHDMPSSAMRLEGNDYRIFSNLVERVVTESDDQGGIDIYRDPSYAGVLIAYNAFRDIGTPKGADNFAFCGQSAVRLDGNISSMTIYSNCFERCGRAGFGAVQINGGRNNRVEGNTFVDCACGVTISAFLPGKWLSMMEKVRNLYEKNVDIHALPYSTKYPGIATLDTQTNQVNTVVRNTLVHTEQLVVTRSPDVVVFGNHVRERSLGSGGDPAKAL